MFHNTVVLAVYKLSISSLLSTSCELSLLEKKLHTHFMNLITTPVVAGLYTFFNSLSSVISSFKQYPQGLYKLLQIKYILII